MTSTNRARQAMGMPPVADAEPEPGKELTLLDKRILDVRSMEEQFAAAMPHGAEAKQLVRDAITALRNVPELAECTRSSFMGALMTAAQLSLRPNVAALGHGWILPFRDRSEGVKVATWITGYEGMIELSHRTERIASISAHTIYSNEKHLVRFGTDERIEHEPIFTSERGVPVLWYACCWLTNGGYSFHVMGKPDVERIRLRSKAKDKGPWVTDYNEMAKKSCLRQLWKWMPKDSTIAMALAADDVVRDDFSAEGLEHLTQVVVDPAAAAGDGDPGYGDEPPPEQ